MGKKGAGASWLTAVKRAFRSPTKDERRRIEDGHPREEDKKREKRRWLFRKTGKNTDTVCQEKPDCSEAERSHHTFSEESPADVAHPFATWHYAAIIIQTAFRAYLARRALRALKGLVKLQALVRGHNVRRQAKMTLKCMQALVKVQSTVLDQRMRLFATEASRKSTFSDTVSVLESRYRNSDEEFRTMVHRRKNEILSAERRRRSERSPSAGNEDEEWLEHWIAAKPWDNNGSRSSLEINGNRRYPHHYHRRISSANGTDSPLHRSNQAYSPRMLHSPAKPGSIKITSVYVRDDRSCNSSQTPSLKSNGSNRLPNYMAATESAKARLRPQSAPKQRPQTPERDPSNGRKRNAFPAADPNSPSLSQFSVVDQQSNFSTCYTESIFDEASPSSTSNVRRWLR